MLYVHVYITAHRSACTCLPVLCTCRRPVLCTHTPTPPRQELATYEDKFNNPMYAAKYGFVDDVIQPRTTRSRLCRELALLHDKHVKPIERKHANPPL